MTIFTKELDTIMILYSPAKINIGLQILEKRSDGFHEISSLMLPVSFFDMLEIHQISLSDNSLSFTTSGIKIPGATDSNLCVKAFHQYTQKSGINCSVKIHLHKQIPFGAGLGGGSSNASTVLLGMNHLNNNALSEAELVELAADLGSDCPLFIYEKAMMASGRGDILNDTVVDLSGYYLLLLNPGIIVSTEEAFRNIIPDRGREPLAELLSQPVSIWNETISNDFEESVFSLHPQIRQLKEKLYAQGAIYASMSGSGSSVYGIYKERPELPDEFNKLLIWEGLI